MTGKKSELSVINSQEIPTLLTTYCGNLPTTSINVVTAWETDIAKTLISDLATTLWQGQPWHSYNAVTTSLCQLGKLLLLPWFCFLNTCYLFSNFSRLKFIYLFICTMELPILYVKLHFFSHHILIPLVISSYTALTIVVVMHSILVVCRSSGYASPPSL